MSIRAAFRRQAQSCDRLGSPFTAKLLALLADRLSEDTAVGRTILNWPGDPASDALALRVAGALHAQVLSGRSPALANAYPPNPPIDDEALWRVIDAALGEDGAAISGFIQRPPQTNEVARSAALAGGFMMVSAMTSLPLAILEIGSSAGLNLCWDAYGYEFGDLRWGAAGLPVLAPAWEGPKPPAADVLVVERAGCDQTPIDVGSEDDVLRLRAYVWPDQSDRLERLDQALAAARRAPLPIERADAADWAAHRLVRRREGMATVLFHSIVWQYIAAETQERLERIIDDASGRADHEAPFGWLRMEPESPKAAALRLTVWPGGETMVLADVDYHGRWVRWHADGCNS